MAALCQGGGTIHAMAHNPRDFFERVMCFGEGVRVLREVLQMQRQLVQDNEGGLIITEISVDIGCASGDGRKRQGICGPGTPENALGGGLLDELGLVCDTRTSVLR